MATWMEGNNMTGVRLFTANAILSVAEFDNDAIRERQPNERVHLRYGGMVDCVMCNSDGIWLDSVERWVKHPFRCDPT